MTKPLYILLLIVFCGCSNYEIDFPNDEKLMPEDVYGNYICPNNPSDTLFLNENFTFKSIIRNKIYRGSYNILKQGNLSNYTILFETKGEDLADIRIVFRLFDQIYTAYGLNIYVKVEN